MRQRGVGAGAFVALLLLSTANAQILVHRPSVDGAVIASARTLYNATNITVYNATDGLFLHTFSLYELYVVDEEKDDAIIYHHVMAYKRITNSSFDVTRDFNAIMTDSAVTVVTVQNAIDVAEAYAEVANGEYQLSRRVVNASNSTELGVNISDPTASCGLTTCSASLWTWSPENGVLANWSFDLTTTSITRAEWRSNATATGGFYGEYRAADLRPGTVLINRYQPTHQMAAYRISSGQYNLATLSSDPPSADQLLYTRDNNDGTKWRIVYRSGASPSAFVQSRAENLSNAAVRAHNLQVGETAYNCTETSFAEPATNLANWRFAFTPSDHCYLTLAILNESFIGGVSGAGNTGTSEIRFSPWYAEVIRASGYGTSWTDQELSDLTVGHEAMHVIDHKWMGDYGGWKKFNDEAIGRFSETLNVPNLTQTATSYWYFSGNNYLTATEEGYCAHGSGNMNLLMGYLYQADGGFTFLRDLIYNETTDPAQFNPATYECETNTTRALGNALAASPGLHDSVTPALSDFAYAIYNQSLHWGVPGSSGDNNWSQYLIAPAMTPHGTGNHDHTLYGLGVGYYPLPLTNTYNVTAQSIADVKYRIFLKTTAGVKSFLEFDPSGMDINPSGYSDVILVAVRGAGMPATFWVNVQ